MPHSGEAGVSRVPPWGSFVITLVLLVAASISIAVETGQVMAGAIIGYVAAYWLPARRDADE